MYIYIYLCVRACVHMYAHIHIYIYIYTMLLYVYSHIICSDCLAFQNIQKCAYMYLDIDRRRKNMDP